MLDIQSIVIYIGGAVASFVISKSALHNENKKLVWLLVILLSTIAGLRASSVGIDTKTYDAIFNMIPAGGVRKAYRLEKGFVYVSSFLLHIWKNNQFLFFIYALASNGLIIFGLWKNREYIAFHWSVFAYYVILFTFSLNGMRQFVAVAIVIYATSIIKREKYILFFVLIMIASLFHISAMVGVVYLFFEILFVNYFEKKRKTKILVMTGIMSIISIVVSMNLMEKYSGYFNHFSISLGMMNLAKISMLIISILLIGKHDNKEYEYICRTYRLYYFVGLILNSLSYFFSYAGRIGLYFGIFETFYIGNVLAEKNKNGGIVLVKYGYILILMYYLYGIFANGQGEIPYRFFWQS